MTADPLAAPGKPMPKALQLADDLEIPTVHRGALRHEIIAELRRLHAESLEAEALREKMSDILRRTANALKGEPDELTLHSWHDLPEVAMTLRYEVDAMAAIKEERDALQASMVETRKSLENTVNAAVMWLSLLCEAAGLDPDETTVEFSDRGGALPPITISVAGTITALKERLK